MCHVWGAEQGVGPWAVRKRGGGGQALLASLGTGGMLEGSEMLCKGEEALVYGHGQEGCVEAEARVASGHRCHGREREKARKKRQAGIGVRAWGLGRQRAAQVG